VSTICEIYKVTKELPVYGNERMLMGDFNIPKIITDKYYGLGDLVLSDAITFYQTNKKFGQIDGVIGWWKKATMYDDYGGQSINLTKFWESRAAGKSIEEAALSTFTGSKMKAKGFGKVGYRLQDITENEVIINFLNNMEITFSNSIKHNQDHFDYIKDKNNKYVYGTKYSHSDKKYLELINKSISHYMQNIEFKDAPLNREETLAFNEALEEQIEYWLSLRVHIPIKEGTDTVTYKGETIELDIRPIDINDNDKAIRDLLRLHEIIKECLTEEKPLYLSVYEEE